MGRGYDVSAAAADHQAGTQIPLGARGRGAAAAAGNGESPLPMVLRVRFYTYR